jgi:hypothetical protein
MHNRINLVTVALIALLALALATGAASANRSIEVRGAERGVTASGKLTFNGSELAQSNEITCDITLLRTVTRTIPKISGTLFGKVTGVAIDRGETTRSPNCRHGESIVVVLDIIPLIELPTGPSGEILHPATHRELGRGVLLWDVSGAPAGLWKLIYDSFQGTLPAITGINFHIQGTQFKLRFQVPLFGLIECLYHGNAYGLIEIVRETITRGRAVLARTRLERVLGSGLCPPDGTFNTAVGLRVSPTLTIRLL